MDEKKAIEKVKFDLLNHYPNTPSLYVDHTENLLKIVEKQRSQIKNISTNYISLFVDYIELMDEYLPEWREEAKQNIKEMKKMLFK